MGDDLDPVVRWELGRMAKLDVLRDGEVICDVEDVKLHERTGALVVTDLRVLFVRTSLIRRKTHVYSIPLDRAERVEASADPVWESRWGTLVISHFESLEPEVLEFDRIRGGRERAEEIAGSILRQRDLLRQGA